MPELPEVETVRRTLHNHILFKTIDKVDVFHPKMVQPETPTSFNKALQHQTITDIARIGKYLLFTFTDIILVVHLRMEGKFYIKPRTVSKEKHEHIAFYFTDGSSLRYHDVRKFGTHQLRTPKTLTTTLPLSKLGYEPSDPRLTTEYLKNKFKTSRAIKTACLDQTIILGLGNIYVDEVLFCAKIKPTKKASTLTKKHCDRLIECSKKVINKATKLGGTTIRTYTASLGVSGRFQNELNVHMKANEPCAQCHTPIKKIKVNGRGTYYCPHCQKA